MIPDHPNWRMGRLTPEERRRIFLAKEQTSREMRAPLRAVPIAAGKGASRPGRLRLLTAALIVTLLGGGLASSPPVELHLPASIVEALLPRVE
jgi:hypothetical protein